MSEPAAANSLLHEHVNDGHFVPQTPKETLMSTTSIRSLGLGLVMACAAGASLAAGKTVSVSEKIDLPAAPTTTWNAIKDFMDWQAWHPAFASTDLLKGQGNTKGTVRVLHTKDGAKFTEELMAHDAASRTYRYRIIESPAPVIGYVSTLAVKANNSGSTVVWSSTFEIKPGSSDEEVKKAISGIYRAGLDNLASVVK